MKTLVYTSLGLAVISLILTIIIFVIVIVNNTNDNNNNKTSLAPKRFIDVISPDKNIIIDEPPSAIEGMMLRAGQRVLLNNQVNQDENGMYEIREPDNRWVRTATTATKPIIISNDQIAIESRRIQPQEILTKHLIIAARDVILPDPKEFKGLEQGEILKFTLVNCNETDDVELGYSSFWTFKGDDCWLAPRTGSEFILRNNGDGNGEIYRITS